MLRLLSGTDLNKYRPRTYIIASTDNMSETKVNEFEMNVRIRFDSNGELILCNLE